MVQALSPDAPDSSFRHRILPRTPRGREHLLHAQAPDAPLKPCAIHGGAIAEQVSGALPGKGLDELLARPLGGGVFGHVEMDHLPSVVGQHDRDEEPLETDRGTAKKSSATLSDRWLFKKARQVGEEGLGGRTRYFSIVEFATGIPSFRNSPRMRGDPQHGVVPEISRISVRSSGGIPGRPGPLRLRRAQWARNRWRCQASTVADCTKTRTSRQRGQPRDSHAQTRRSGGRTRRRRIDRR